MAPLIRRGTSDDARFLAWVMLSASRAHLARGLWEVIIGSDEAGCLDYLRRLAIGHPRSLYHCENFLIVEVAGQPAAALCGFEVGDAWGIVRDAMANVQRDLGWTAADAAASHQRVAPIWSACRPPDVGADFVVENVATVPAQQRRGLIGALMDATLRDATARGCKLAEITTYIGNEPAQRAYEKYGFQVQDEKRCAQAEKILGVPGFVRLTRELKID